MPSIRKALLAALFLCPLGGVAADRVPDFSSPDGQYLHWLDRSVKPGVDFFHFANGAWLEANPIPPDRSEWGAYDAVDLQNQRFIHDMVDRASRDTKAAPGSVEQKVGDFYASGMDGKAIDDAGIKPLRPELDRIAHISSVEQLPDEFTHLQMIGVSVPLALMEMQDYRNSSKVIAAAMQAGLGLPDRDFYVQRGHAGANIRAAYVQHIARTLQLLGDDATLAQIEAKSVMALETSLAKGSMTDVAMRDPRAIYPHGGCKRRHANAAPALAGTDGGHWSSGNPQPQRGHAGFLQDREHGVDAYLARQLENLLALAAGADLFAVPVAAVRR